MAHDLVGHKTRRVALEALQGYLEGLTSDELRLTVATLDVTALSPVLQNFDPRRQGPLGSQHLEPLSALFVPSSSQKPNQSDHLHRLQVLQSGFSLIS